MVIWIYIVTCCIFTFYVKINLTLYILYNCKYVNTNSINKHLGIFIVVNVKNIVLTKSWKNSCTVLMFLHSDIYNIQVQQKNLSHWISFVDTIWSQMIVYVYYHDANLFFRQLHFCLDRHMQLCVCVCPRTHARVLAHVQRHWHFLKSLYCLP